MTALVTLNNVAMRYPSPYGSGHQAYAVFDGINFELTRGERVGVVGRNGVGKSTLLRIMAKIFAPYPVRFYGPLASRSRCSLSAWGLDPILRVEKTHYSLVCSRD